MQLCCSFDISNKFVNIPLLSNCNFHCCLKKFGILIYVVCFIVASITIADEPDTLIY